MTDIVPSIPSWITTMRQAAQKVIKPEDVEQIVANQVKLAKEGDKNAIRFIFEQVLGGQQVKAATFVQNNYHGQAESPSDEELVARRNGNPLDGPWQCSGCRALVHQPMAPTKCRHCNGTRFNRKAQVTA